jgi:glutathione S-transferase
MMQFYYSPGACSLAVHVALEEAGASFEAQRVSLADGEQLKQAYLAINPQARVPALVADGQLLTEVLALLLYVDQRFPAAQLMPADPLARARLTGLMGYLASTVHISFAGLWRPERFTDNEAAQQQLSADAAPRIANALNMLELALPEQGWLGGAHFSVADAYVLPFYRWAWRIGLLTSRWPRLQALAQQAAQRPAVQRVVAREGITLVPA